MLGDSASPISALPTALQETLPGGARGQRRKKDREHTPSGLFLVSVSSTVAHCFTQAVAVPSLSSERTEFAVLLIPAVPATWCSLKDASSSHLEPPPWSSEVHFCGAPPLIFQILIISTSTLCSPRLKGGSCFPKLLPSITPESLLFAFLLT